MLTAVLNSELRNGVLPCIQLPLGRYLAMPSSHLVQRFPPFPHQTPFPHAIRSQLPVEQPGEPPVTRKPRLVEHTLMVVVTHKLVGTATPYSAEVVLVYLLRARSREVPHFVDAVCASGLVEWLVRAVGAEETSPG